MPLSSRPQGVLIFIKLESLLDLGTSNGTPQGGRKWLTCARLCHPWADALCTANYSGDIHRKMFLFPQFVTKVSILLSALSVHRVHSPRTVSCNACMSPATKKCRIALSLTIFHDIRCGLVSGHIHREIQHSMSSYHHEEQQPCQHYGLSLASLA